MGEEAFREGKTHKNRNFSYFYGSLLANSYRKMKVVPSTSSSARNSKGGRYRATSVVPIDTKRRYRDQ